MAELAELRAEIEALRDEIAALKAEREAGSAPYEGDAEGGFGAFGEFGDQVRTLVGEVSALADKAEKGVTSHPLAGAFAALVLGVLIGRSSGR